jgi:hypothetical protein
LKIKENMNIDFLFYILNKIDPKNEGIKLEEIIDYIKPYLLYLFNNNTYYSHYDLNSNYYTNVDMILSYFNQYLELNFLILINNKYFRRCN